MSLIYWLINKLFLVKEIREQDGTLHFRRWRLLSIPWFRIYIHNICLPDYDLHRHDHPWNFVSILLKGHYSESWVQAPDYFVTYSSGVYGPGEIIYHKRSDAHKIEALDNTWSLVFAFGPYKMWGYRLQEDPNSEYSGYLAWMDHVTYRKEKRAGLFDKV